VEKHPAAPGVVGVHELRALHLAAGYKFSIFYEWLSMKLILSGV
jgi:hypothetical protein